MKIDAMLSSKVNTWGTPRELFRKLDRLFGFTLDACAFKETAKCLRFVHPNADGLNVSWNGERVWNNPPYDDCISWMPKARNESLEGVCLSANLVPVRGDTEWWANGVLSEDMIVAATGDLSAAGRLRESWYDEKHRVWWYRRMHLITGVHEFDCRITFDGKTKSGKPNNAPFPSALVIHASPGLKPRLREGITTMWPRG